MKRRNSWKKDIAAVFILTIVFELMHLMGCPMTLRAEESTEKTIAGLGTSVIANPQEPKSTTDNWQGSYVYFGNYEHNPIKYRVLTGSTTDFGGTTMLLDCDSILCSSVFDDSIDGTYSNIWKSSSIKSYLNSTFFTSCFSVVEQEAIAPSTKAGHLLSSDKVTSWTQEAFKEYVALEGEKIFLLDAEDVSNESYGYSKADTSAANKVKMNADGKAAYWWLRSAYSSQDNIAGVVDDVGEIYIFNYVNYDYVGVAPALNVNLSSVLFSSVIQGTEGEIGAEYKLTLLDKDKAVQVTEGQSISIAGSTVTVPYTYTDNNTANPVNRISVMITDKVYTESDAQILYYGALQGADVNHTTGTAAFTLPDSLTDKTCGTDYYAYLIAENVNGEKETDYASTPQNIIIPAALTSISNVAVSITEPKAGTALAQTALSDTAGLAAGSKAPSIVWKQGENIVTADAAYNTVYTAEVAFVADMGHVFADNVTVTVNGKSEGVAVSVLQDGTLLISCSFTTAKAKLISIAGTQECICVANGTAVEDFNLPDTVSVVTEDSNITAMPVSWNTDEVTEAVYDPSLLTEQSFTLSGTVVCPDIIDRNNVSLSVSIDVTVNAAGVVGMPTASPIAGTYTENQMVELSSTTEGAVIYYTTDGSVPSRTNGTQYTGAIVVEGTPGQTAETMIKAVAVKDGMQDSRIGVFLYIINLSGTIPNLPTPPVVTVQPCDVTTEAGDTAAFFIEAAGTAPLSYQWKIDRNDGNGWVDINGATQHTYITQAVDKDCNGFRYKCVVSNSAGSVESNAAVLCVRESEIQYFPNYRIIAGANSSWTQGSSTGLIIIGSGDYSKFTAVKVDGSLLDQSAYGAQTGSTVIVLKAEYLNTLPLGIHTFEILWADGSAGTVFTINAKAIDADSNSNNHSIHSPVASNASTHSGDKKDDVPKTGDDTPPVVWMFLLMIISGAGVAVTGKRRDIDKK